MEVSGRQQFLIIIRVGGDIWVDDLTIGISFESLKKKKRKRKLTRRAKKQKPIVRRKLNKPKIALNIINQPGSQILGEMTW